MKEELQQRLQSLSARERSVLGFGIVGAILILVYSFFWQPWQDELNRLRTQVPLKQETLQWMQQQSKLVQPLLQNGANKAQSDAKPVLTVVEQMARAAKIKQYIRRMAPGENNQQVKIWLTDTDFDAWLLWLERLRKVGIEVNAATVSRTADNKVTIRVTLQR